MGKGDRAVSERRDSRHYLACEVAGVRSVGQVCADMLEEITRLRLARMTQEDRRLYIAAETAMGRMSDDDAAYWHYQFPASEAA